MRKEIITESVGEFEEFKKLTITNIAKELIVIFKDHIGKKKSITKASLFKEVFNRHYSPTLADELRLDYLGKAMHSIRKNTKCFIGSYHEDGEWNYYVLKTKGDADDYSMLLNNYISKIKTMQNRAHKAVELKWYKQKWTISTRQKTIKKENLRSQSRIKKLLEKYRQNDN